MLTQAGARLAFGKCPKFVLLKVSRYYLGVCNCITVCARLFDKRVIRERYLVMDENEIVEEREEEREEMTNEEEHRYDEYEGLARRIDDLFSKFDEIDSKLDVIKAGVDGFVEAGAVIDEAGEETESENLADIVEAAAVMDAFDDLDFVI